MYALCDLSGCTQCLTYSQKVARPASLFEMHQAAQAQQPDKEENDAIWDRDRDMGSGGRLMDQKTRSKLIQDAKSLGDRFGSSKRGAYN